MTDGWIKKVKLAHLGKQLNTGNTELNNGQGIEIQSKFPLGKLFADTAKRWNLSHWLFQQLYEMT